MIELELQALSLSREGLLVDVGRSVAASGFALVRQRLADDANGVLLTMVVRGPVRNRRTLEAALDAHERIVSFELSAYVSGVAKPHFAASRAVAPGYVPPPPPTVSRPAAEAPSKPAPANQPPVIQAVLAQVITQPEPLPVPEPEPELVFMRTPPPAPAPVAPPAEPFVEVRQLDADAATVEQLMPKLADAYPRIFPLLKAMEQMVEEGARESSLLLAGQRLGAWVFERRHASGGKLGLEAAMAHVGLPALRALLEVEQHGQQLHIRNSPLCTADGRSSCKFLSGYLEGLLVPATGSQSLSIFAVCCRSCGADECVLAVMD